MTNGIQSQSFLGMVSGVTTDSPIISYTPTPISNPNWYNQYTPPYTPSYTPPYVYHPPQPPENPPPYTYHPPQPPKITPQTPPLFYYVQPPALLYTPPYTLTCHTTLSTGQPYYAIETITSSAPSDVGTVVADSQLRVAHQVFEESPESPMMSITKDFEDKGHQMEDKLNEMIQILEKMGKNLAESSNTLKGISSKPVSQFSHTLNHVSKVGKLDTGGIVEETLDFESGDSNDLQLLQFDVSAPHMFDEGPKKEFIDEQSNDSDLKGCEDECETPRKIVDYSVGAQDFTESDESISDVLALDNVFVENDSVSGLGGKVAFMGSGDACDEGFNLFKQAEESATDVESDGGEENWDTTEGHEPWNLVWDWDDDIEEDGIAEEKEEVDGVENNDSDEDGGLYGIAMKVFDEMPARDVTCWNAILSCYYHEGQLKKALGLFEKMKGSRYSPDSNCYTITISSCAEFLDWKKGQDIHYEMLSSRFPSESLASPWDSFASGAHVDMYGKFQEKFYVNCENSMTATCVFDVGSGTRYDKDLNFKFHEDKYGMVHKVMEIEGLSVKDKVACTMDFYERVTTSDNVSGLELFVNKINRSLVVRNGYNKIMCNYKLHEEGLGNIDALTENEKSEFDPKSFDKGHDATSLYLLGYMVSEDIKPKSASLKLARELLDLAHLPVYYQCQSQLRELYAEGNKGCGMEFSAYNLHNGTINFVAHVNLTVVEAISGVQTVHFKKDLEWNITTMLAYANTKIYKCEDKSCPRLKCYKLYRSGKEDAPACDLLWCENSKMTLLRYVSFVDCPCHDKLMATMLNGAAIMDWALLLIAVNESCPQPQPEEQCNPHILQMQPGVALYLKILCKNLHATAETKGSNAAMIMETEAAIYAAEASNTNDLLEGVLPENVSEYVELAKTHIIAGSNCRFTSSQLLLLGEMIGFSFTSNRAVAATFIQEFQDMPIEHGLGDEGNEVVIEDGINFRDDRPWVEAVLRETTANFVQWMHCFSVTGLILENTNSFCSMLGKSIELAEVLLFLVLPEAKNIHAHKISIKFLEGERGRSGLIEVFNSYACLIPILEDKDVLKKWELSQMG